MNSLPQYLYKVISPEAWQESQRQTRVVGTAIDTDFMHLAKSDQVDHVIQKFWKNQSYVILTLDPQKFEGRLIYEKNRGGTTYYYHLYDGKIPLSAVVEVKK